MARLREITAQEGIAFLDLTGPLRASRQPAYFTYDGHWTAQGHAVAARARRDTLRAQGWLGRCAGDAEPGS
jgi:hypothetical protein